MSGSGQDDFRAPTYLTPIAGEQAIATVSEGSPNAVPTMYFVQLIQRILSYIGQPTAGNVPGQTLSSQVGANAIIEALLVGAPGAAGAGLDGRVARLESVAGQQYQPLPQPPGLNQSQVLARIWFFS